MPMLSDILLFRQPPPTTDSYCDQYFDQYGADCAGGGGGASGNRIGTSGEGAIRRSPRAHRPRPVPAGR